MCNMCLIYSVIIMQTAATNNQYFVVMLLLSLLTRTFREKGANKLTSIAC